MKLAIVSDAIYPYNKGGKEKRIFEISTRLAKKGIDVHIYTMKWWKGEKEKKENGVTLHAISKLFPLYAGRRRSIKEAFFFSIDCFKLLTEDFDVIEADHMPHLVLFPLKIVSLIKRKKLYVTWNEVWGREYWVEYMGILGNVAYGIEYLSSFLPDIIISVSEHTTNKLKTELKVKQKIMTIPNGINFTEIQQIKPSSKKSDVLYVGRLLTHKHIDVLIEAISVVKKSTPKIICFIIGEGPERANLEALVKRLNLVKNVFFFDFMKHNTDVYGFMKASHVFVLPSTREGFGIVAIEANACGIPFITTNNKDNAARDHVQKSNGKAVPLDLYLFAKAINDRVAMEVNKNYLYTYAQSFDWDTLSEKVSALITK